MPRREEAAENVDAVEGHGNSNGNEWENVEDYEERRKIQNRVAQRNYRARKKIRHQGKQGDLEQNFNLQDSLEPLGLNPIGPQNLLDGNSSSVDHESLPAGVQDYNSMFREPWVPCDLTKPPTPLDMAWSSMPDPTSTPPAQHYPYAYLNLFQPNLPSNSSHTPNSSNTDSLPSGSGLQTLYSSASSQQHPDSDLGPTEAQASRRVIPETSRGSIKHPTRPKPRRREVGQSERSRKDLTIPKKVPKQLDADPTTRKGKTSSTQQRMLQCAYKQGRKEALASSNKEQPTLHDELHEVMDRLVEMYEFGVNLDIFKSDARFEAYVQAAKRRLPSQSRHGARKSEQDIDSGFQSISDRSETDSAEGDDDGDDRHSDDVEEDPVVSPVNSRIGKFRRHRF